MAVPNSDTKPGISRRLALSGAATAAAMMGLGHGRAAAVAQDAQVDYSGHPMTGTWMAMANPPLPEDPQIAAPSLIGADGTVLLMFPLTQRGPGGVQFTSAYVGVWEPDGERRGHFTATQVLSDAAGAFLGTVTVDGYPEASDDGQTFIDDGSRVMVTIRDATGAIVQQIMPTGKAEGRPVTGIRMGVGMPGFAESVATPAATPAV